MDFKEIINKLDDTEITMYKKAIKELRMNERETQVSNIIIDLKEMGL